MAGYSRRTVTTYRSQFVRQDQGRLRWAISMTLWFTAALWVILFLLQVSGVPLRYFAIYPGRVGGLFGILTAPLVHGGYTHLLANSITLVVLGSALLYGYPRAAKIVVPVVYLGTGLLVWVFARPAYHLGASGLSFGIFFFVLIIGALRRDRLAVALSMAVFFLYSGMIWGVLPNEPQISFESHIFGALIGSALAFILKNKDPLPPQLPYDWEGEDDDDDGDWERFTK